MSSAHFECLSTGSTLSPMIFVFRLSNSGLSLAMYPNSVVQTGVKSRGCENSTAQESPIQSWNRNLPSVVSASKSGAVSAMWSAISVSCDVDGHLVDGVGPVAEPDPFRLVWLGAAGAVDGPGSDDDRARPAGRGDQFPPLPVVALRRAEQPSCRRGSAAEADLHAGDRRRARPSQPTNDELTRLDLLAGRGFGDQGADPLQGDRLGGGPPLVFSFVAGVYLSTWK